MNRLVCGDVGFGKTEVALRAAFIVASCGAQVVVVVPTTLLCHQHYKNFKERLESNDIKIAELSRLVSKKAQVKRDIFSGKIDVLVTTHGVFSKSMRWSNLGLIIIDEEHKFGVKQKEMLKENYPSAHILTMSATPIPRTLQIALGGQSQLSMLTTPPFMRKSIKTRVVEQDPVLLKAVILDELEKKGQVLYICPHITDIEDILALLKKILPEKNILVAHGQKDDLEKSVEDFLTGRAEVLIATNIIEAGLDIIRAGTIIVHRADRFGMAQLHQIRGRVGRGSKQGFAYFTVPSFAQITHNARHRLEIVARLSELGMGFNIASYDLENRGGGNILGKEQSGFIKEVGFALYQQMLKEALSGAEILNTKDEIGSPEIDTHLSIVIPTEYIYAQELRLAFYRRMAKAHTVENREKLLEEMKERFGRDLPQEVINVAKIMELKELCIKHGVKKLSLGVLNAKITPATEDLKDKLSALLIDGRCISGFNPRINKNQQFMIDIDEKEDAITQLEKFFETIN